ncbi:MAG: hypothetical protein COA78_05070 [Blastopirellula sp.]|nr:MAG: hypothetical protein COA78_05070 [Blastopirellula sp.]
MIAKFSMQKYFLFLFVVSLSSNLKAESPDFKSQLFKTGTLVYSDDFDQDYSKERWGAPKKDREIKDGKLIFVPLFNNAEEAQKALGRDHHLGLGVVAHLNKIPEKFVCHMRFKFEAEAIQPARPVLQIGHHMILLTYLEEGGHRIKLPGGPSFTETKSNMKLNEWVDLIIEYQKGKILIGVNGFSRIYEHKNVTIDNKMDKLGPRFSFKHSEGPKNRLVFDHVRLWEIKE